MPSHVARETVPYTLPPPEPEGLLSVGGIWDSGSASLATHPEPRVQSCAVEIAPLQHTHTGTCIYITYMHTDGSAWMTLVE